MKKYLFIFILSIVCYKQNNAQNNVIDSLLLEKKYLEQAIIFDAEKYIEVFYELNNKYAEIGDYHSEFELVNSTMNVYLQKHGNVNTTYIRELMLCLSNIQYNMNNIELAIKYGLKAENLFDIAHDYENPYYISLLTKLNDCYQIKRDTTNTKKYFRKALELYKNKLNNDIWNVSKIKAFGFQNLVNDFGLNYANEGNYEMAEKFYKFAIKCNEDTPTNMRYLTVCGNLALLYSYQERYNESAELIEKCLPFCKDNYLTFGFYQILLTDYIQLKDTAKVIDNLMRFNVNALNNLGYHFTKFAELERYDYWSNIAYSTLSFNNWATYSLYNPLIHIVAFEMNVYYRNFILNYSKWIFDVIKQSGNADLIRLYKEYISDKFNYVFGENSKNAYYETLSKEEYIINNTKDLKDYIMLKYLYFEDIHDFLSEDEYLIQFCDIGKVFINTNNPIQSYYTVFILGKHYNYPLYYFVCPKYEVDNFLIKNENEMEFYTEMYSQKKSYDLYKTIFKPIEHFLKNAKTIYYAPSGDIVNINFDLLTDSIGTPLNQKYKMVRVSSTANIPQVKALDLKSAKTSTLYGGIDYKNSAEKSDVAVRGVNFRNLPNTGNEVRNISRILTAANIKADTLCGENATEQSFKLLSGNSPDILHVATHGFYLEDDSNKPFAQSDNTYSQKENAMVLSGLALSGANNVWKGNFDLPNIEDGVLTAYEISQLDLSNTKLAVLSACETARGKIFPVDGVFGLQRAFKQAGAGAILMSLWKVDDQATALFMEHFYKFLLQSGDRHEALKLAQDEAKKQYPDPYYWAAWVMLD